MNTSRERLPMTDMGNNEPFGDIDLGTQELIAAIHLGIESAKKLEELEFLAPLVAPHEIKSLREQADEDFIQKDVPAVALLLKNSGVELISNGPGPRRKLRIDYDENSSISFNGAPAVSLTRKVKSVNAFVSTEETEGNAIRLEVMKILAENPEKAFLRHELWNAFRPGEKFDRPLWDTHIRPFLQNPPVFEGMPLVHTLKIFPKVNRYVWGNFDASFKPSREELKVLDDPIFRFENGDGVTSKTGALLTMLKNAGPGNLVMNDDFLALYDPSEVDFKYPAHQHLRRTISGIKNYYFKDRDTEWVIWSVKSDVRDPDTGFRQSGYYMEKRLSLAECASACQFLAMHAALLQKQGIITPSDALVEALQEAVINDDEPLETLSTTELRERRRESFEKLLRLRANKTQLDSYIKRVSKDNPSDPRLKVLEYFDEVIRQGGVSKVREILASEYTKPKHKFVSSKQTGLQIVSQDRSE